MRGFTPDFLTAFGMTALAAFTVSWVMWVLGRPYSRQGMVQAVLSTLVCGVAYTCFALQSRLGILELQVTAKILISVAISLFTLALQRFRQSTDWPRDTAALVLPVIASLVLAALYLPEDLPSFNRMQTAVTVLQTFSTLHVLHRLRSNAPGLGWMLVAGAIWGQLLSIVPLVFVKDRPAPAVGGDIPLGSLVSMWALCLVLFLKLMVSAIGFLIMLRDRQAALAQHKAQLDPLTQLPNRATLVQSMQQALAEAAEQARPVAVMVLDIDHFKRFNDNHGHLAGDQVIQLVAHVLQQQCRSKDTVARYGGEEFVLVLPGAPPTAALAVAQRLCQAVRQTPLVLADGTPLHVTVSVGVHVTVPAVDSDWMHWETWIAAADEAMYRAKRSGRDRVVLTPAQAVPPTPAPSAPHTPATIASCPQTLPQAAPSTAASASPAGHTADSH